MYDPPEVTEPPRPVAGALKQSDAALLIGTRELLWTEAVQEGLRSGLRVLSSAGISEDNFYRSMKIDYAEVWKTTKKVQSYFSKGRVAEITSPQGTNLLLEIGYPLLSERAGMVSKPGEFDFLPTGIASAGVKEGTANGTLVIDGSFSQIGIFREPIILTIKNRRIVETSEGFEKREFHVLIDMFSDPNMYNVAAIFAGTNLNAKFTCVPNEDERVIGMMNVQFGDNTNPTFGGNNRACMYLMSTLTTPRLVIDGQVVLENGTLKV